MCCCLTIIYAITSLVSKVYRNLSGTDTHLFNGLMCEYHILFLGRVLWLWTVTRRGYSNHHRMLSRILAWLLSRICSRLEDFLFRTLCHVLWHNHHGRLLHDNLARLLNCRKFLHYLLSVELVS